MTTNPSALEIALSAATHLGLALEAARTGNVARTVECLASIDARSWEALLTRFPGLPELIAQEVTR